MEEIFKMKKIICALLSLAFMFSLTACGESEVEKATEIKEVISTYETNLENADFSKFSITYEFSNRCEYNHDLVQDIYKFRNMTMRYDESGYLYYKNQEEESVYRELWLYIDGTNLILATISHTNSKDTKKYDILEFNSYEKAHERFLEEAPKSLDRFEDWYYYLYNEVCEIPATYCTNYFETASNLCERVINELDPSMTVITNDGTTLDIKFSDDQRYVFENGILKSYNDSSSGRRQFNKNGIGTVTETYDRMEKFDLLTSCNISKPDLSTFEKIYH